MRIVIISGTSPPEPMTAGRVHWDLANHLASENNLVWLITPKPSRPLGTNYPIVKHNFINKVADNFYHIRINSFTYPNYSLFYRTCESADFGLKSIIYINKKIIDYDLIYASPWAFLGQLFILVFKKNKKVPVIMNVQDLYPESFLIKVKSKMLSPILNSLYLIDNYIAKKSTHITVISESLKQVYINKRKISESKISVIRNWQDSEVFLSTPVKKEEIMLRYNLTDSFGKFIYMYLGNIGPVAGVDTILNSFSQLNNDKLYLIIAGSGSAKDKCQLLARKLKIANLAFIEVQPGLKPVVELQSISDIMLLPINPQAASSSIPSKLIAYMFSGKPIITSANVHSETALAIKTSKSGWITRTNNTSDWVEIMELAYKTDRVTLNAMGKSGFEYAIENYSKEAGLRKISQLIYKFNRI
jgi:glycosyltransferase involved in cell wall biosynthesis